MNWSIWKAFFRDFLHALWHEFKTAELFSAWLQQKTDEIERYVKKK